MTLGLALTLAALAFAGAVVMRLTDPHDFPSFGLAIWWALQTVTTVGYGDVVPTTNAGRLIAGFEMVFGVSFVAFLTAAVTSTVIHRQEIGSSESNESQSDRDTNAIMDAIRELERHLDDIEAKITK